MVLLWSPWINSRGVRIISPRLYLLWFIGNGCEDHLTTLESSIALTKHPQWRKMDDLLCNILDNLGAIKLFSFFGLKQRSHILISIFTRLYLVISSIDSLGYSRMEVSSFVERMIALIHLRMNFHLSSQNLLTLRVHNERSIKVLWFILILNSSQGLKTFGNRYSLDCCSNRWGGFCLATSPFLQCDSVTALWANTRYLNANFLVFSISLSEWFLRWMRWHWGHWTYYNRDGHPYDRHCQFHGHPLRTTHVAQNSNPPSAETQPLSSIFQPSSLPHAVILIPINMRIISPLLNLPNLPLLLLLPKLIRFLLVSHTLPPLALGFSISVEESIFSVEWLIFSKTFSMIQG